jgi:hypothetical protein
MSIHIAIFPKISVRRKKKVMGNDLFPPGLSVMTICHNLGQRNLYREIKGILNDYSLSGGTL